MAPLPRPLLLLLLLFSLSRLHLHLIPPLLLVAFPLQLFVRLVSLTLLLSLPLPLMVPLPLTMFPLSISLSILSLSLPTPISTITASTSAVVSVFLMLLLFFIVLSSLSLSCFFHFLSVVFYSFSRLNFLFGEPKVALASSKPTRPPLQYGSSFLKVNNDPSALDSPEVCIFVSIYKVLSLFVFNKCVSARLAVFVGHQLDILYHTIFLEFHLDGSLGGFVLETSNDERLVGVCC